MNRQWSWYLFTTMILILGLVWIWLSRAPHGYTKDVLITSPFIGFTAPDFTLPGANGETFELSSLKGNPVIVNFWATWCLPCRSEMPAIQKIYQEYSSRGLSILAVNATSQDDPDAVLSFIDQFALTFPVLFDETGQISNAYRIQSLPTTFFIDQNGIIQGIIIGGMSETLLNIKVKELFTNQSKEAN
jgi:cytochrome c biogenesis protein CcmG, thiol:disulfide interchange protein DsbE